VDGWPLSVNSHTVEDINSNTDWGEVLQGVDVVIHTAARAHIMEDKASDSLSEFRKVNVDGTLNFAKQSAESGIKQFVFISSVKVNGEDTELGRPFNEVVDSIPGDPYGLSKYEAEQGLYALSAETGMEVVIIRAPLIYGSGVKANFKTMMKWLACGIPLPLGGINNHRSLLALDNLVDFILTCIAHPAAANQTFLVLDDHDLSTSELLKLLGEALGKPARLFSVPANWVKIAANLVGKSANYRRLCGSLRVDISKAKKLLGWRPPISAEEGLRGAAKGFLDEKNH
jgi:nucleoside-diphosphate-sugar epimerase